MALFFRSMNGELRTVDIATVAAPFRVAAGSGSRGAATLHHGADDRARRPTRQAVHGAEIKSGEVRAWLLDPVPFAVRLLRRVIVVRLRAAGDDAALRSLFWAARVGAPPAGFDRAPRAP